MAYQILLQGQDITNYVDVTTLEIDDTLGQGSGTGSANSGTGRATTFKVKSSLGPLSQAIGAGQTIPAGPPKLVRQGEIIVTDVSGNRVFGGFATKYTDQTEATSVFTYIEGVDYDTSLQRIIVQESFSGQTDVYIINFLLNKYAPWINLSLLPASPAYLFSVLDLHQVTLAQALAKIAQTSGYLYWIDFYKYVHYVNPAQATTAPFYLSSSPDFITSFPHGIAQYEIDDNSAINRVTFYGGTKLSNDTTQDVSTLANGSNTMFPFAYPPQPTFATGDVEVFLNNVKQVVGSSNGTGPKSTFVSQGGIAQVLVDVGGKLATFDPASPPASGASVKLVYRYQINIVVVLTDEVSHAFFGNPYLDGIISDQTVFDTQTAIQRCRVLLLQQNFGLTTLKAMVWRPGLQSGQTVKIVNSSRQINATFLIQEVKTTAWGGGQFQYEITMGAWNWNLVDLLVKTAWSLNAQNSSSAASIIVDVPQAVSNAAVHDAWSYSARTMGGYYARATPVGDGHDAYPGFSTITT